ncbi:MAG: hypothetical protein HS107_07620 [Thermoflexaceae bacterium]|nr:hypothetical protein [Thermoflexaceae bacterium]
MTAKQALRERIENLSEEEAAELLARLDWEASETEALDADELAEVIAARAEIGSGDFVDGEELFRRLKL